MEKSNEGKYFFIALYALALVALLVLFSPFLTAIVIGGVTVIFFYPVNEWLGKYIENRMILSGVSTTLVLSLIVVPMVFIGQSLARQGVNALNKFRSTDIADLDLVFTFLNVEIDLNAYSDMIINQLTSFFSQEAGTIIGGVVDLFVGLVIILFILYYGFKDGGEILNGVMKTLPVSDSHRERIREEANDVLYAVMYGQFAVAVVQGVLGGIAFTFFGIANPVFWGFLMGVLSFIPGLGPPVVWLPISILEFVNDDIFAGVGLFLFGAIIIGTSDNILKPMIIGDRTGIHPLLVIFGIFGGLTFFGLIGFIVGPVLVGISALIIRVFNEEFDLG